VDKLHRIVIPQEICNTHGIEELTPMEIFVESDRIILQKYERGCTFCGNMDNLKEFGGEQICASCRDDLRKGL